MGKFNVLGAMLVSLLFLACGSNTDLKEGIKSKQLPKKNNVIEVIDFHGTNRCVTCKAIESNAKLTIETFFQKEMEEGKITFSVVNADLDENAEIARKFEATGTALFLNVVNNGVEEQVDLTEFAFINGKNEKDFTEKFKVILEGYLNKF